MSADNLKDLFIDQLKDIYDAEQRLTKALPKLARAADSEDLVKAFNNHLTQTEEHVARLEGVFESLAETPKRKTCKAMVGLLEEGQEIMDEKAPASIKDLGLIAAAQKVEHYEIATYGCMRAWADLLGEEMAVENLQKTLDEESAADRTLTEIAMTIEPDVQMDEDREVAVGTGHRNGGRKRPKT